MIALGIDPGTRNLGWGVVKREGNRLIHLGHGVIRMNGDWELPRRLAKLFQELQQVVEQYRPEVGSVEGIFFDKNAQSAAKLGHARGVVLLVLEQGGLVIREHAPSRVKRTLTGNGQADKAQVAQVVTALLSLAEQPPSDAADALAIALTELRTDPRAHLMNQERLRKKQGGLPPGFAAAMQRAKARKA